MGFPEGSVVKNPPANAGNAGSVPESGRSPGEGNGSPLQYSCLGNPMDRGAWWATVHGIKKRVSHTHTHTHTHTKDGLVTTQPQMIALNFCSPPPNQNITCMPSPVVCLITEKLGGPAVLNLLYDIPKPAGPCSPKLLCLLIVRTVGESGC